MEGEDGEGWLEREIKGKAYGGGEMLEEPKRNTGRNRMMKSEGEER
jgi:hypothetical protein